MIMSLSHQTYPHTPGVDVLDGPITESHYHSRVPVGTLAVRLESYVFQNPQAPNMRTISARPVEGYEAVAVRGHLVCSNEPVEVSLQTPTESMGRRASIEAIRTGAGQRRAPHGEMADLSALSEKPIWRFDSCIRSGNPAEDAYTKYQSRWATPYCNYTDMHNNPVSLLEHIDAGAYATASLALTKPLYRLYLDIMKRIAMGEESLTYSQACRTAAKELVAEHVSQCLKQADAMSTGTPRERLGFGSVTIWHPEHCIYAMPGADMAALSRLEDYFASDPFKPVVFSTRQDIKQEGVSFIQPDCVVRFVNDKNECSGHLRVNEALFRKAAAMDPSFDRIISRSPAGFADPGQRARLIINNLHQMLGLDTAKEPVMMDILLGHNYSVSRSLVQADAFGRDPDSPAAGAAMRFFTEQALQQSTYPWPSPNPRQSLGADQFFIPRGINDAVQEIYHTADGNRCMNAALLKENGKQLLMTPEFRQQVSQEENELFNVNASIQQHLGLTEEKDEMAMTAGF